VPATAGTPRIHYQLHGVVGAPGLVMLRGLGRGLLHWGPVVAALERHFQLILIDNRGVGRSQEAGRPYGVADMAQDVVRVLDHAGIERAHLFGMSLGGMIAQRFAIDHPARVDRLALGCTTPGGRKARRPPLAAFFEMARARLGGLEHAIEVESRFLLSGDFRRRNPHIVREWVEIATRYPVSPRSMLGQLRAAAGHSAFGELHRIEAPTLIVSSDVDPLIPPENSRLLARRIPRSEIAWIKGALHDFATENPGQTAHILTTFMLED